MYLAVHLVITAFLDLIITGNINKALQINTND